MSETHTGKPPIPSFTIAICEVFKKAVEKSGGVSKEPEYFDLSGVETKVIPPGIRFEAALCDGDYTLFLELYWNGNSYVLAKCQSIELTDGDPRDPKTPSIYLMAESVETYENGRRHWGFVSPKGLLAWMNAHNRWSKFHGLMQVFANFD